MELAGADIKEMSEVSFSEAYKNELLASWSDLTKTSKPIIAAVNGYAVCTPRWICLNTN